MGSLDIRCPRCGEEDDLRGERASHAAILPKELPTVDPTLLAMHHGRRDARDRHRGGGS